MKTHHKSSKRTKLSLKYNIQKRIREHKRRLKKEAKKMGVHKKKGRDPGIPNSWPFKAEMLQELEEKREKREEDMAKRRAKAKEDSRRDHKREDKERREAALAREEARREKRAQEAENYQTQALRKNLPKAQVLLQVLDARDPMGCRCAALEAWASEQQKRMIFVLAKADLITPDVAAKWVILLGQIAPTIAVQAEAGREGIRELLSILGHTPAKASAASASSAQQLQAVEAVTVVGYSGTGKRALCKAMRQEMKSTAAWLLDPCKLRPVAGQTPTASLALHSTFCANTPPGNAASSSSASAAKLFSSRTGVSGDVDPIEVIKELLSRVPPQNVMRYFRLPAFEGAEGFLKSYAEDRKMRTKKDKVPQPPAIAFQILVDLLKLPGAFCEPEDKRPEDSQRFWPAFGDGRQAVEQVMTQQVGILNGRGKSGPAVGALVIASSAALGPAVDLANAFKEEPEMEGEADVGDDDEDDDMDDEGAEEEEECLEGEESEEDMSDDE